MEKFSDFISEQKNEQPYKLVVFQYSAHYVRDVEDTSLGQITELLQKSAKSVGVKMHSVDFNGLYLKEKNGKQFLNSFKFGKDGVTVFPDMKEDDKEKYYQEPIEINPKDTLIMPRGLGTTGFTNNRNWTDLISKLELNGYTTINSLKNWDICSSKYYTDIVCRNVGLKTPKTVPIAYSEDTERAVKELNTKFPIILKSSTGTQTGIGVLIIESMRSLHAAVQMLLLYNKFLPIVIQEYIKTDYDVRVIILDNKVLGAMRRNVITGDIRSNVSMGATAEKIDLTELEINDSIKAAKATEGRLVGVDFIPSKNREKEQPYILEVNSMPGFGGIEKLQKGLTANILTHFKNRENWRKQ